MKYLILANDVHLSIVNPTKLKVGTHEWSIKAITYYIIVITYYIIAILGIYLDQPSTNFGPILDLAISLGSVGVLRKICAIDNVHHVTKAGKTLVWQKIYENRSKRFSVVYIVR